MSCKDCGGPLKDTSLLVPDVCGACRDAVPAGPHFMPGEVGYIVRVVGMWPAGPFRQRKHAELLASLNQGTVEEVVPVSLAESVKA